jgi:hypothetical protein
MVSVVRCIKARTYFFPKRHFRRGLRPYGALSRSCSPQTSAEPHRGAAAPLGHPLGVPPVHPGCVIEIIKGRT